MPLRLPAPPSARRLAPWLVLLAPLGGCQCGNSASPTTSAPAPLASAPAEAPAPEASAVSPAPTADPNARQVVGASQIVIAWKGAELAPPTVTRSKDDARKLAEEVLAELKASKTPFEDLARRHSDDISKAAGGAMGNFERSAVPPALADAAFSLEPGTTSDLIETPRGFHILRRTR